MATLLAAKAAAGVQPKGLRVGTVCVTSIYSLTTSLTAGDIIQMIKCPANSTLIDLSFAGPTTHAGTVNVGDGVSTARYLTNYLNSAAAVIARSTNFVPYVYSTDDTIDILVSAASTGAIGGAFYMTAIFSMDA